MGLTDLLLRAGAARPHVLLVTVPGATAVRLSVEADAVRRGWPTAPGPADADIMVVAGDPGTELAAVIERVWAQLPAPRTRVRIADPEAVPASLDAAKDRLLDLSAHRRSAPSTADAPHGDRSGGAGAPERDDTTDALEHGGSHEQHGGSHEQHGGSHGMDLPGGLAMAGLGPDRDGLMLDRLHVRLGPVLPDWPDGLVVDTVLQGDVVQEASARVLGAVVPADDLFWAAAGRRDPRRELVRRLDGLAQFLGVAGWPAAGASARRLRDDCLAGASAGEVEARVGALLAWVRRSRVLRHMLWGLRAGDVTVSELLCRNLAAVHAVAAALTGPGPGAPTTGPVLTVASNAPGAHGGSLRRLETSLVGAELAAARLIVAAIDPNLDTADTSTAHTPGAAGAERDYDA